MLALGNYLELLLGQVTLKSVWFEETVKHDEPVSEMESQPDWSDEEEADLKCLSPNLTSTVTATLTV